MTRLNWHEGNLRTFETGIDRGVLYPKGSGAVPWFGLTGVDETGADSVQSYFIDGRPFLHVPKTKEYAATIKAWTYPDELTSIMGMPEVTDGMYIDSQQADQFDLCYRTLVGDGAAGVTAGYKIHVIYNAVVVPGGVSFVSSGSSIEPTEFSWDISAVPMPLVGYRSSAHVVIDTRHMDQDKLSQIEGFLYGTAETEPFVPEPQVIFDTLSYGDSIIVTDLGDGTFEVQGSYKNVQIVGDGIFNIDNVDGTDNGDGTWTISTTL